jgi:hypothetical protein
MDGLAVPRTSGNSVWVADREGHAIDATVEKSTFGSILQAGVGAPGTMIDERAVDRGSRRLQPTRSIGPISG